MYKRVIVGKIKRELLMLYLIVLVMYSVPALILPAFRSTQNLTNILNQMVPVGFVALGQTFAILTTGIDLSVGAMVSLTTTLAATYMGSTMGTTLAGLGLCLLVGIVTGLVNGSLITGLKIEPLIVTLGTSGVISGIALAIMPYPGGYVPSTFTSWWSYRIGDIVPVSFVIYLGVAVLLHFILNFTRFGRRVYAVGGDERKATVAGINTNVIKIGVFTLSSLFAAVGGLALAARMYSGDPLAGNPFTLSSIAAVIVGGTTFSGGVGGVTGTIAGVAIMSLLSVILNLFGVSPYYQNVLSGVIVVVAVTYSSLGRFFRSRKGEAKCAVRA